MFSKCFFAQALLIFLVVANQVNAQKNIERQVRRLETEAGQLYDSKLYQEALPVYLMLDSLSPNNSEYEFRIGLIYFHSNDKAKSLTFFLHAREHGKIDPNLDFYMARAYHFNLQFDSAVLYYHKALNAPDSIQKVDNSSLFALEKHIQDCRTAKALTQDSLLTPILNLGPMINTEYPEYVPLMNEDENMIIFTSRRPDTKGRSKDQYGNYMEDIYISYKTGANWSEPTNDLIFNTADHDACVGLSSDGTKLILYRSDNGGDLYISEFVSGKWNDPKPLVGINTAKWESSACISADGNIIYFTSDRSGGYGGADIYQAKLLENGKYGEIKNLGPEINTSRDEDAPQIHKDGKTLFFSSKGGKGMGGYDIYSSVFNEKTGQWTKPRNIGYPINTPDDDIYFSLLSNGSKGFFSSYRYDSFGEKDLYMLTRPGSVPTNFIVKLKLFDPYTKKSISAKLTITDNITQEKTVLYASDTIKGKYSLALQFDRKYSLGIEAPGYQFKEKELSVNYRADVFEYIMNVVPSHEEIISLVDSSAFVSQGKSPTLNSQVAEQGAASEILRAETMDDVTLNQPADDGVVAVLNEKEIEQRNKEEGSIVGTAAVLTSELETEGIKKRAQVEEVSSSGLLAESKEEEKLRIIESIDNNDSDARIKKVIESEPEVIFLTRIDTKEKLVIPIVNFEKNSFQFDTRMQEPLSEVARFLKGNPEVEVLIYGHTDTTGGKEYNKQLSIKRAKSVSDFLMHQGVSSSQLNIYGFGEDLPLLNNKSVLGRMLNRRVTMTFIDSQDPKYTKSPYLELVDGFDILITPDPNHFKRFITWEKIPVSVHFQENRGDYITEYSSDKLIYLANYMKRVPYKLVMVGFASNMENGSNVLALQRAKIVYEYMTKQGIDESQLMMLDLKEIENIYDVNSESSEVNKRRVQFFIVKD